MNLTCIQSRLHHHHKKESWHIGKDSHLLPWPWQSAVSSSSLSKPCTLCPGVDWKCTKCRTKSCQLEQSQTWEMDEKQFFQWPPKRRNNIHTQCHSSLQFGWSNLDKAAFAFKKRTCMLGMYLPKIESLMIKSKSGSRDVMPKKLTVAMPLGPFLANSSLFM